MCLRPSTKLLYINCKCNPVSMVIWACSFAATFGLRSLVRSYYRRIHLHMNETEEKTTSQKIRHVCQKQQQQQQQRSKTLSQENKNIQQETEYTYNVHIQFAPLDTLPLNISQSRHHIAIQRNGNITIGLVRDTSVYFSILISDRIVFIFCFSLAFGIRFKHSSWHLFENLSSL